MDVIRRICAGHVEPESGSQSDKAGQNANDFGAVHLTEIPYIEQ